MKREYFTLKVPLLGWPIGQQLSFDPQWGEWTVTVDAFAGGRTHTFDLRSTVASGEKAILLNCIRQHQLTTIMEPKE